MRLRTLGHEYRCALPKPCRHCRKSCLGATLGWACIDNLVSAIEQQREKTGLGPAGKRIIAHDEDTVMLRHVRLDHGGSALDELATHPPGEDHLHLRSQFSSFRGRGSPAGQRMVTIDSLPLQQAANAESSALWSSFAPIATRQPMDVSMLC